MKKNIYGKLIQTSLSIAVLGSLVFIVNACRLHSKQKVINDLENQIEKTKNEIDRLNQQIKSARKEL